MPQEFSVGAVIYNGNEFLLVKYIPGHWGLVKGKCESGEKKEDTLRRELFEGTGIKGVYIAKDFSVSEKYFFKRKVGTVYKEVEYLLGEVQEKEVKLSKEHLDFKWLGFQEAMSLITFKSTKNVFKEAHDYLKLHGGF